VSRVTEDRASRAIVRLQSELPDQVILPEHPDYDAARRVYFTGVNRLPAAAVRPRSAEEVAQVVRAVREEGVRLSVKGGGHGFASRCVLDGGVVLDLSAMQQIEIDTKGRIARAQTGLTTGGYTSAAATDGLATGFGDSPDVGLAGISLAGGFGFLHRKFGLTVDSILGAEVVTAEGEVISVNAGEHPDLFWALRGGGGNFGVVTRLDLRLHPVDQVVGGMYMAPANPRLFWDALEFFMDSPEEVSGIVQLFRAPPMPMIPEELHGEVMFAVFLAHCGPLDAGEGWTNRLRQIAPPALDAIEPTRYVKLFEHEESPPPPPLIRWRSTFRDRLTFDEVEGVFEALREDHSGIMRVVQLRPMGGAVSRVPSESTAFAHRSAPLLVGAGSVFANSEEGAEHAEWTSAVMTGLSGTNSEGCYAGFVGEDDAAGALGAWPESHRGRLRQIKGRYDPENLFRGNVEIPE